MKRRGSQHHVEMTIEAPSSDVMHLFGSRPASWLLGFLQLAILTSGLLAGPDSSSPPWYRLGVPEASGAGRQ